MKISKSLLWAGIMALAGLGFTSAADTFAPGKGAFELNGQPFTVKAAELHYPRIPRPYWDKRIKQVKALGMNTVCLYVFWNAHEPQPDVYDFEGQNDLREFVKLCQENDLKVILRPGPYVCAEWEMGGMPWWLLQKEDIRLRELDPYFMERVAKFEARVAEEVKDLTIENGGPIIMVQVENEYGSYGESKPYVSAIRDTLRNLYGPEMTLFQCDWSSNFTKNGLDDLTWTMNFGTGADIDQQFAYLKDLRPDSPLMCSEFWSGWFDKWGANHETRPAEDMIAGIDEMLSKGISFSLYMTHGGTNWGHWAGANSPGFAPDVTSYDYDAPISESGELTPKYHLLRETLQKYADTKLPSPQGAEKPIEVAEFELSEVAPLWESLPAPVANEKEPRSMEQYGQGFGSILYSTNLTTHQPMILSLNAHDYAQVFVDGRKIGTLDRRMGDRNLTLPPMPEGGKLDILVEAMGRINFGRAVKDFKGLVETPQLGVDIDGERYSRKIENWDVTLLPDSLDFYKRGHFYPTGTFEGFPAGVYQGTFNVKKPSHTFLDFQTWGKGLVYVNGHPMGRIWGVGPQQTLYMPGCWLKEGENEIVVFDILGPKAPKVRGLKQPLLDQLANPKPSIHRQEGQTLDLSGVAPAYEGVFGQGNGWQWAAFKQPAKGRYVAFEVLDGYEPASQPTSIAEFYLQDADGNRIVREPWTVVYADSEDVGRVNRSADKVFDLQESTYWSTLQNTPFPHTFVLDLGSEQTVNGVEMLPRMEQGAPGQPRHYRVYVSPTPFKM